MGTFDPLAPKHYYHALYQAVTGVSVRTKWDVPGKYGKFIIKEKMTKQEQIAQLKQTIQDAKEQVERLEKGCPKWEVGNVVRILCGIRLVTCLGPADFTLISLDGHSYCGRYPTLVDLECAICGHQDTEVLANTVAEYYANR